MRTDKGFTLIEILVVVFLIASFVLLVAPNFGNITEINIKSASRNLTGTIKYLYNEAAFKKKIYKLEFDIESGEYWTEILEGNEFLVPADPSFKRRRLPGGVYFKEVKTERTLRSNVENSEDYILFLPTGFVEPAVIYLQTEDESYYTIATKPYTGGARVFDEYVDIFEQ